MATSSHPPTAPAALPPLIAAYVEATNSFDLLPADICFRRSRESRDFIAPYTLGTGCAAGHLSKPPRCTQSSS
jgi:hypothetical protein